MAFPSAGREPDSFAVLVKVVYLAVLEEPFAFFIHRPHAEQDMGVRVAVPLSWMANKKLNNHPHIAARPSRKSEKVSCFFYARNPGERRAHICHVRTVSSIVFPALRQSSIGCCGLQTPSAHGAGA